MSAAVKWMLAPLLLASAPPALAAFEPNTKLVECAAGDCLLVTGHREDPRMPVRINGREIKVEGNARWQAKLPVHTFRAWSAPDARTVTVTVDGQDVVARLPIGMMVKPELLSMLVIRP